MVWSKVKIKKTNGEIVEAQALVIISASRSTDIPAFYADWFVGWLKEGYVKWKNRLMECLCMCRLIKQE